MADIKKNFMLWIIVVIFVILWFVGLSVAHCSAVMMLRRTRLSQCP